MATKHGFSIAQMGFPRSGNHLFLEIWIQVLSLLGYHCSSFRVLRKDRRFKGIPHPVNAGLHKVRGRDLYRFKRGERSVKPGVSEPVFPRSLSIFWMHDLPSRRLFSQLRTPDTWYYVYRDGRDAVTSLMHFVIPLLRKKLDAPSLQVSDLIRNETYFLHLVRAWHRHVQAALKWRERVTLIRYEDIVHDRYRFLREIQDRHSFSFPLRHVYEATAFKNMKREYPGYLRKGGSSGWRKHFNVRAKTLFKQAGGESLVDLGYERNLSWS